MRHLGAGLTALFLSASPMWADSPARLELTFQPEIVAVGAEAELRVTLFDANGHPVPAPKDLTIKLRRLAQTGEAPEAIGDLPDLVVPLGSSEVAQTFTATDEGEWKAEAAAEGLPTSAAALQVVPAGSPLLAAGETLKLVPLPENGRVKPPGPPRSFALHDNGKYKPDLDVCWFEGAEQKRPERSIVVKLRMVRERKDVKIRSDRKLLTRDQPCTTFAFTAEEAGELDLEVVWEGRSERVSLELEPAAPALKPSRLRFAKAIYRQKGVRSVTFNVVVELLDVRGNPWAATQPYSVRIEVEDHNPPLVAMLEIPTGKSTGEIALRVSRLGAYLLSASSDGLPAGPLAPRVALHAGFDDELFYWCLGGGLIATVLRAYRSPKKRSRKQLVGSGLFAMAAAGCAFLLAHWQFFKLFEGEGSKLWQFVQGLSGANQVGILVMGLLVGLLGDVLFQLIEGLVGKLMLGGFSFSGWLPKAKGAR